MVVLSSHVQASQLYGLHNLRRRRVEDDNLLRKQKPQASALLVIMVRESNNTYYDIAKSKHTRIAEINFYNAFSWSIYYAGIKLQLYYDYFFF